MSVNEILADAWALAKKNIVVLLGFTIVQFAFILIITTILTSVFGGASGAGVLIQNIILSLFDAFFTVAFYQVFFKLIDEDTAVLQVYSINEITRNQPASLNDHFEKRTFYVY